MFRVEAGATRLYVRLAESEAASLAPEAYVHELLRARGARVPEVVCFEELAPEVGRSVLVTTEIVGAPVDAAAAPAEVLRAAGRDLAVVNAVAVAGFGWVRRDRAPVDGLEAELPTHRVFALADMDVKLAAIERFFPARVLDAIQVAVELAANRLGSGEARLAHGDFDAPHIFQSAGAYTGVIDFGEIRGADSLYDLGHFALHDATLPLGSTAHLIAGSREVASLPDHFEPLLALQAVVIGVHALARVADRPAEPYKRLLVAAIERHLQS